MLCSDTGSVEAIHVPMTVDEARDIGNALRLIRSTEHGSGEVCIPVVNGWFDKIRMTITTYRNKKKKAS
jgi:hypothetical protein